MNYIISLLCFLSIIGIGAGLVGTVESILKDNAYAIIKYLLLGISSLVINIIIINVYFRDDVVYIVAISTVLIISFFVKNLKEWRQEGMSIFVYLSFKKHCQNLENILKSINVQAYRKYFHELLETNDIYKEFAINYLKPSESNINTKEFHAFKKRSYINTEELARDLIHSFHDLTHWTYLINNDRTYNWKRFSPNISEPGFNQEQYDDFIQCRAKRGYLEEISKLTNVTS